MSRSMHVSIGAFLMTLTLSPGLCADEIHVPGDVPTIQIAINLSANGDDIVVAPGTYFETIDLLGKAITLRSSAGAAATTIDALGQLTSAVKMISGEGSSTVLEGFTITRGDAQHAFPHDRGGGLYVDNSSPTIRRCVFVANAGTFGGGLYCNASNMTVVDCEFQNNVALRGGGLYLNNSSGFTMTDCVVGGNVATNHGAGLWAKNSNFTADRCVFRSNIATAWGGAMYFDDPGSPVILNTTMHDNEALAGSAIATLAGTSVTLRHCTVTRNPSGDGVAIETIGGGLVTVQNSILWEPMQIPIGGAGGHVVSYSNVSGGWAGTGNINLNPRFVDLGARDLRLRIQSPCIDAGDSNVSIAPDPTDLDGRPRAFNVMQKPDTGAPVFGLTVDMGAYEARVGQAAGQLE